MPQSVSRQEKVEGSKRWSSSQSRIADICRERSPGCMRISTRYIFDSRLFLRAIIIAARRHSSVILWRISHFCHSRAVGLGFTAIMIAVELGFQPDTVVQRERGGVVRLDLQARAFCPLVLGPGGQAGDDPPSVAASLPAGIRDYGFVAQQAIVDGAVCQRYELAIDRQGGERGGDRDRADNPTIGPALLGRVFLQCRHR